MAPLIAPVIPKPPTLPVGFIGLGFHRQLLLVCLDGFLVLLHGPDQIRFSHGLCQLVTEIVFGDIIDAIFQEQIHGFFKNGSQTAIQYCST